MSIKQFLTDLFVAPDDFAGDAYGYLTNQIGHVFLGATLPMYIIGATYVITGQYPDQTPIALQFVVTYLVCWELLAQKYRGLDTVLDTFFVAVGASVFIFVEMDIVLARMIVLYTVIYVVLLGTTYRIWLQGQNKE